MLSTGVAGPPAQQNPLLYDLDRVDDAARRPLVDDGAVAKSCPHGYLVARLPRTRRFDAEGSWDAQSRVLAGPWRIDPGVYLVLRVRVATGSALPLVLLVSGFVLAGAQIVGSDAATDGHATLALAPPGDWFEAFRGRRCPAGRGRQTELRGWPSSSTVKPSERPLQQ